MRCIWLLSIQVVSGVRPGGSRSFHKNPRQFRYTQSQPTIVESDEVFAAQFNPAFVAMQYFGYLRRDPDPDYNKWLTYLNAHPGDFRTMVKGFMNSVEYRLRFGQP